MRSRSTVLFLAAVLAMTACGGGGDDPQTAGQGSPTLAAVATTAAAGTDNAAAATTIAATPETDAPAADPTPAPETPAAAAPASSDRAPICDTIPSLEVISAAVGEQVTKIEDLSDPSVAAAAAAGADATLISDKCEATGEGAGMAIFERWDVPTATAIREAADVQALAVPFEAADLPGAFAWGNGVMVERDGIAYVATIVNMGAIMDPRLPETYAAAADLLRAWFANL